MIYIKWVSGVLRLEQAYTDVVEAFKYDSANEQYNMDFLQWRRHSDSKLAFRFSANNLENVYVSGTAVVQQNVGISEREALMRCGQMIGAALLIYFVTEIAGESLLQGILRLFDIDVRIEFLSISMQGSQWAVVAARAAVVLLKYLLPTALLIKVSRFPRRVFAPAMKGGIPELSAGVGAGMMIAGVYALIAQRDGIALAQNVVSYKDTTAIIAYGIFDSLLAATVIELFLRGTILMLLRQFGDPFAVFVTALIGFLFPNQMPERIAELLIGLAAGYLMIRSGSLPKCIALRVVFTGLSYARVVMVYTIHNFWLWEYSLLLISFGALAITFFILVRRRSISLNNQRIVLSHTQKFSALMQTVTMLPWAAVSVLLMLVQLFY